MTEDREERARYEVLFEQNQANFRVVVEKLGAMMDEQHATNARLDRMEPTLNHIGIRVDVLETKVDNLETKVDNLETKVGNLETKVGNLETKVGNLETKVGERLGRLEASATHTNERLGRLEASATHTNERLGRIEAHLKPNGAKPRRTTTATPARRSKKR